MSDQKTMVPEVKAALLAADVSEETIALLEAAGFTTAASLTEAEKADLAEAKVIVGDRAKVKQVFPKVVMTAEVKEEHVEEVKTQTPPANKYAAYLSGASSIGLSTAAIMATRLSPEHLNRGAMAVSTFIVCGTGADRLFVPSFFTELGIKDLDAADAAFAVAQKIERGDYITDAALHQMFGQMPSIFGKKWLKVMDTTRQLSAVLRTNSLLGSAGQYQTNTLAPELAELTITLPSVAEEMSQILVNSPIPVMSKPAVVMVQDIMSVVKMPGIQRAAGIVESDPDTGAIEFLQKRCGPKVATAFRLAVVAERLVRLLGVCPQSDQIDAEYLGAFGQLAVEYRALYDLAMGDEGAAVDPADKFRPTPAVASPVQQQTTITKRWSFKLTLQIG